MTTLRGTASEMHTADDSELTIPRRRGGLVLAAIVLVLLASGGLFAWPRLTSTGVTATSVPDPVAGLPGAPAEPPPTAPVVRVARDGQQTGAADIDIPAAVAIGPGLGFRGSVGPAETHAHARGGRHLAAGASGPAP